MKKVILFDGVCHLCDQSVQFILKHDKEKQFLFASYQGATAMDIQTTFHLYPMQSIALLEGEKIYTESSAVLRITKNLAGIWKVFYVFILVPKPLRDTLYRLIAKNRYKWFGKMESCRLPTKEEKERFLP